MVVKGVDGDYTMILKKENLLARDIVPLVGGPYNTQPGTLVRRTWSIPQRIGVIIAVLGDEAWVLWSSLPQPSYLETGYVYAPYVPMQTSVFNHDDFAPRKSIISRGYTKKVNPDYFCTIVVRNIK